MTNRWRRTALTTAAAAAGSLLFFTGSATAEPAQNPPTGSPVLLADDPGPSEFATRVDLTMPTQIKTGIEIDLKSQTFGVDANKGVNGGMVQFLVDGVETGAQIKAGSTGLATLKHTFTTAGPHTVSVQYLGGGKITGVTETAAASSTQGTITAVEQDVATVVEILPNDTPVETGVQATLKAKVSLQSGGILPIRTNGKVSFYDGDDLLGTATSILTDGTASIKATFLHSGTRTVTARFSGNTGFAPSTSADTPLEVQHKDLATSTTLLAPNSGRAGQPVTLTATVTAQLPADGTVQFLSGSTPLGAPVPVVDGVATAAHIFEEAGEHSVTAVFTGTGFVTSTSAPAPLSISAAQPGDTTTTVTAPAATIPGIPVTLTANVAPAPYGGTVQFYVGDTPVGDPVSVVNGFASIGHSFTDAGTFQVTARYSGHIAANPSTSAAAAVTVVGPGGGTGSVELPSFGSLTLPFGS
ncbi:Ig-like domain repeat protein [Rhodococcus hoagii]|nr:Ig-like domain repeat protein [Prescottella equi]NKR27388.1 Ig-like domain repeat protein [Prescottella equi]NKR40947.1 Ig-like domain repeat protein [Prescottella equi]NKR94466.1 Ig-like domain repeat protein [Prescottella equi]NKS19871.1 Ig-like domain repeat protein [Prescottella equi]